MKFFILLILLAGSAGKYFETTYDFLEKIKYCIGIAETTTDFIEGILNTSRKEATLFIEKQLKNNSILRNLTGLQNTNERYCYKSFFDKDNLNISFMLQLYQIEVPLQTRLIELKERKDKIISMAVFYMKLADAKYFSCLDSNNTCKEETNEWLKNVIHSFSSKMCNLNHIGINHHSIKKRSSCSSDQFACSSGSCIRSSYFCDGGCDCGDCSDEPSWCMKDCSEFRCKKTFRCISESLQCNQNDDCGDGSDEEGCPPLVYTHDNCSINTGDFLCDTKNCISIVFVCNGHDDCGDGSDEHEKCADMTCPSYCSGMGGVCMRGPKGPQCLRMCPPGTFETSVGCSIEPESISFTLIELIEDTLQITERYKAMIQFLKMKTIMGIFQSIKKVVECEKGEFTFLSKILTNYVHKDSLAQNSTTQNIPIYPSPTTAVYDNVFDF